MEFTAEIPIQAAWTHVDLSTIVHSIDMVMMERRPQQLPVYSNIVHCFDAATWFMLAFSFFAVSATMYLLQWKSSCVKVGFKGYKSLA